MTQNQILLRLSEIDRLIAEQNSKKTNAVILIVVMIIVFWPLLFIFIGDISKADSEIAKLNAEKRELELKLRDLEKGIVDEEVVVESTNKKDHFEKLKNLKDLRDSGAISDDEFQELKEKILEEI